MSDKVYEALEELQDMIHSSVECDDEGYIEENTYCIVIEAILSNNLLPSFYNSETSLYEDIYNEDTWRFK